MEETRAENCKNMDVSPMTKKDKTYREAREETREGRVEIINAERKEGQKDKWIQRKERECQQVAKGYEKTRGTRKKLIADHRSTRFILTYFTRTRAGGNFCSITPLPRQGVFIFCRVRMTRMGKQCIEAELVCVLAYTLKQC